jgi:chemotaxis signal transduction protein
MDKRAHETTILFIVGETTFAIAASAVDEIREVAGLQEFNFGLIHPKLAKVTRILERDGGPSFVVEAGAHFDIDCARPSRVMVLRHAPVGVLVDAIDRMQDIYVLHALPEAFSGEERKWYRGLTLISGRVVPVVRPEAFLSKAEATLLNATWRGSHAAKGMAVIA